MLESLQLTCRFSLPPNSLGYCGLGSAPEKFKNCVIQGISDGVEEELSKFIVLNPYLETLSVILDKPKFSLDVTQAYWIGNNGLEKATLDHYQLLLDNFSKQGVPAWLVDELRTKVPKVFIPHHLFQVLHVGVGRASGSVPYNIETINNCMIRWGEVVSCDGDRLSAKLHSLGKANDGYMVSQQLVEARYITDFMPSLKVGNIVAVHWGQAVKILTPEETKLLEYWTQKVISLNTFLT